MIMIFALNPTSMILTSHYKQRTWKGNHARHKIQQFLPSLSFKDIIIIKKKNITLYTFWTHQIPQDIHVLIRVHHLKKKNINVLHTAVSLSFYILSKSLIYLLLPDFSYFLVHNHPHMLLSVDQRSLWPNTLVNTAQFSAKQFKALGLKNQSQNLHIPVFRDLHFIGQQ